MDLQESVALLEEEMVVNELLLNFVGHPCQRVVAA